MSPGHLIARGLLAAAVTAVAGCEAPMIARGARAPAFSLPELATPDAPALPVGVVGTPGAAPTAAPPQAPMPSPLIPPPAGSGGGGDTRWDLEVAPVAFGAIALGAAGPEVALPPGAAGNVTLMAPDHVLGTIVLPPGNGVAALHPLPLVAPAAPTGRATVRGQLGPGGAGLAVSFRAAGRGAFYGATADATGAFSFQVPVDGSLSGVVLAAERSESPQLAVARVTIVDGQTHDVALPALTDPGDAAIAAPPPPAGMGVGVARLAVIDAPRGRLDLLAFSVGRVPRYDGTGLSLAGVFEAQRPDSTAGSELVTVDGAGASFLDAPDLAGLPAQLAPGEVISWPAVAGASLYTLRLQRPGAARPLWEGAGPYARMRLPAELPTGHANLELLVEAWSSSEVSVYSVASLAPARALRIPATPTTPGGRRSWALRRGLGS
jgi:hypothetical protein